MRAFVFTDTSLARHAGRFVWLEIDTENPKNAAVRRRLKIQALPTFFVVDPVTEKVAIRWVGGMTLAQLERVLADGAAAVGPAPASPASADTALARADRLYGDSDHAAAAAAYEQAVTTAPGDWPQFTRAVEALMFSLSQGDSTERLARLAEQLYPRVAGTPTSASVAASGLAAAIALPEDHPRRGGWIALHESRLRGVLADPVVRMADDDRSGYLISLLDARQAVNDSLGARRVAAEWSAFLDSAAAAARTPDQRAVFDSHRLSAYLELGEAERAIPMLEASQRDFPDDYNPPARLAAAYVALKRWDEALAACDRAMALAYGPRKLRIFATRADALAGRGDAGAARSTLEEAIAYARALPEGQASPATIASLEKKRDSFAPRGR
jgi:tetratricopeptide (TPR) repeat protein